MGSLESLLNIGVGGNLRARASRGFYKTTVTSYSPRFPRSYFPARRVTFANTNVLPYFIGATWADKKPLTLSRLKLNVYEDRRQWHPLGASAPARSLTESYPAMGERLPNKIRRRVINDPLPSWWPQSPFKSPRVLQQARLAPIQYGFMNPNKVVICLKRKIRKEIMHALGFAGGPVSGPHFNAYSRVRC